VVGQPLFVTFRLHGTLPANRIFVRQVSISAGRAFVAMDRSLDAAGHGPSHLGMPEIAAVVVDALRTGVSRFERYKLHSYVVMPNHVHALVTPHVVSPKWLGPLKGFTGHEANAILGLQGKHFWQDEIYDHPVKSDSEFDRIRNYIEQTPVNAGLAALAQKFRWSSAYGKKAA
jgi:REP element-mobilizing transposase RayT